MHSQCSNGTHKGAVGAVAKGGGGGFFAGTEFSQRRTSCTGGITMQALNTRLPGPPRASPASRTPQINHHAVSRRTLIRPNGLPTSEQNGPQSAPSHSFSQSVSAAAASLAAAAVLLCSPVQPANAAMREGMTLDADTPGRACTIKHLRASAYACVAVACVWARAGCVVQDAHACTPHTQH